MTTGGFVHMMERLPPERLSIAVGASAAAQAALYGGTSEIMKLIIGRDLLGR